MLKSWLPITRIKIFGATILYKIVTLFIGKGKRVVERDGIKYELDVSEGIELSMYLFGNFQKHILSNKHYRIKPGDVIFDIGTNIGLMTLQFAKLVPQGKVYSFEPTHYAIGRLKTNLSLNPELEKRVQVINTFVSEKSSENPEIVAFASWKVSGERSEKDHPVHLGTPMSTEGVPSISMDDFTRLNNIQKVNFIKIDTDGHEYEVFKGGKESIRKYRPYIIFEIGLYVMDEKKIDFDFYFNYFRELNYKLVDTKTDKEISLSNYRKYIPKNGSTDLIAIPL